MLPIRIARGLAVAMLCFSAVIALAQPTSHNQETQVVVGRPWKGPMGVKATTKQIMQWQQLQEGPRYTVYRVEKDWPKISEDQQAPGAVFDSQFPPAPTSTIKPFGGISPTPRFSVGSQFDGGGLNDMTQFLYVPPDTQGDVSPNSVLVVINGWVKSFDRNGNLGALNVAQTTFFNSVRGGADTGDARVRYDRLSGRWIVTAFTAVSSNNRVVFAVSDGPAITNSTVWTFFFFQHNQVTPTGDNNLFFDYPTLGVDSQALYIGGNLFNISAQTFNGTSAFVVRKSSILGAGPIIVTAFRGLIDGTNTGMYTPQGVDNDDPNSTDGYFLGQNNAAHGSLIIRKVSNPGGTPTLGSNQFVANMLATNNPPNVPALGSTKFLDGLDVRPLAAKIHHNTLTGVKTLWTTNTVRVNSSGGLSSADRTASRWYEIENFSTSPSLRQGGTVFDSAGSNIKHYWMPAVAMNRQGHAVIGMSIAGTNDRAGVAYAYRLSSDSLGTMRAPVIAQAGLANYNISWDNQDASSYRWGDYSHTVVDPTDGMSIWTFQEYCNALNNYQVRVVRLLAPPPATPSTVSPNNPQQGSTVTFTVTGTSSNGSGFFDPGAGFPNHLGASFSGAGVTVSAVRFLTPTTMEIDATIAAGAATGARTLTVTNPDGQTSTLASAITIASSAPALNTVVLPATTPGGTTVTGTVNLTKVAPAGGVVVALSSNNAILTVPASVTVAAGSTSANFNATAGTVPSPVSVTVTGSYDGVNKTATTEVRAVELSSLTLNRTSISGGTTTTTNLYVNLAGPAPAGGITVSLNSSSSLVTLPASLTVAAGKTQAVTSFTAGSTNVPVVVTFTGTWQGTNKTINFTVYPPTPSSLTLSPTVVAGGSSTVVTGTVTLSRAAPAGGVAVALTCGSSLVSIPSSVTVAAGQTTATFNVTHLSTSTQRIVTIFAESGAVKVSRKLTINAPSILGLVLDPKSMPGAAGLSSTGTFTLSAPAPAAGSKVTFSTNVAGITITPSFVTVAQGGTGGTFTITAPNAVATDTVIGVTASYKGTKTVNFTVLAPKLSTAVVSPTSVTGGSATSVKFTVTLKSPAPAGGMVVNLSSSNTAAATVPSTITIPAGALSAFVTVTHKVVAADTTTTLTASLGGITKSSTLTVRH